MSWENWQEWLFAPTQAEAAKQAALQKYTLAVANAQPRDLEAGKTYTGSGDYTYTVQADGSIFYRGPTGNTGVRYVGTSEWQAILKDLGATSVAGKLAGWVQSTIAPPQEPPVEPELSKEPLYQRKWFAPTAALLVVGAAAAFAFWPTKRKNGRRSRR